MDFLGAHLISFIIVFIVALAPSDVMKATKSRWYKCIRPSITPPNYVFPLVWSFLYICIALALAQIIMLPQNTKERKLLLTSFGINLLLNIVWSFMYFGAKDIGISLVILLCIIATQLVNMWFIYNLCIKTKLPTWTFHVLLPYTLWLMFAGVLNGLSLMNVDKCKRFL